MAAYNDVNGVAATEQDHVNNEVVKGEWGWDGLLMCDWFATKTSAPAALGGLDLVMPGPDGPWGEALVAAVESRRGRRVGRRRPPVAGCSGSPSGSARSARPPATGPTDPPAPDAPTRREQLRRLAADGMAVLRNDGASAAGRAARGRADRPARGGDHLHGRRLGPGATRRYQVSIADGLAAPLGDGSRSSTASRSASGRSPAGRLVTDPETGEPGMRVACRRRRRGRRRASTSTAPTS